VGRFYHTSLRRAFEVSPKSSKQKTRQIQETAPAEEPELRCDSVLPQSPCRTNRPCVTEKTEKEPLGPDDFDILKEIVQAYKDHRLDFSQLPRCPRFKHPKLNSGIRLNDEIRKRCLERAKSDPDGTGGSLSSLIELLLWTFLGCPPDVVERFPR
jgi:hypothetical protein